MKTDQKDYREQETFKSQTQARLFRRLYPALTIKITAFVLHNCKSIYSENKVSVLDILKPHIFLD